MEQHLQDLYEVLSKVDGYVYPNEIELNWSILIVLYPYITGLVAGAFILASLERIFKIKILKPTYGIAYIRITNEIKAKRLRIERKYKLEKLLK